MIGEAWSNDSLRISGIEDSRQAASLPCYVARAALTTS